MSRFRGRLLLLPSYIDIQLYREYSFLYGLQTYMKQLFADHTNICWVRGSNSRHIAHKANRLATAPTLPPKSLHKRINALAFTRSISCPNNSKSLHADQSSPNPLCLSLFLSSYCVCIVYTTCSRLRPWLQGHLSST